MTNNSPFDDQIKKRFDGYEPQVPSHVWENIIAGKEKRRPAGFLFNLAGNRIVFILMILILSAGGALLVHSTNNNPDKNTSTNKEIAVVKTNTPDQNSNNLNKENTTGNDQIKKAENNVADKQQASTDNKINSKADVAVAATRENSAATPTNNNKIAKKSVANYETVNHQAMTINKNDKAENNKTLLLTKAARHTANRKSSSSIQASIATDDQETADNLSAKNKQTKHSAAKTRVSTSNPGTESDDVKENTTLNTKTQAQENNNDLSIQKYYLNLLSGQPGKEISFSVKSLNLPALNIPCPEAEKNTAGNKRYFEIYGGPDYAFRTFNDTANSTYLQKRKESTHFSSAFSFGIRYTKVFNNAMSFRTGINYSQVNEKFKYEQGHVVQLVYIIDTNGDTTGSYTSTGSRYKTTHNRYRTLDIPLIVGYEMGNGRFHTNINAGLVVNVYSWQKGDILDNAYQPIDITTGQTSSPYQFKTNIGIGFMGGVSLYYKLSKRFHILAEPYFRYNLSPANKSEITLKQKYTTAGVRFGIRMDF